MKPALLLGLGTLFALILTLPVTAAASPGRPVGPEIAVNVAALGNHWAPEVGLFADGGFVVVWNDTGGPKTALHARLFHADGTAASGEFRLLASTASDTRVTSVVVDVDDSFLVAWDDTPPGKATRVWVQRFNRAGQPVKPAFQVHAPSAWARRDGKLALRPGGGFALAWSAVEDHITHTDDEGDVHLSDVYARVYTAAGTALGPELRVNEDPYEDQISRDLAISPNGVLHVLYLNWTGESYALELRRIPIQGRPPRPAIRVSSSAPEGPQVPAALRMAPDGTFFVAWSDFNDAERVYARRFAADGSPLTADFFVDFDGHRRDGFGGLALLPNGGVMVVWTHYGDFENDADEGGIFGHAFGPDGKSLSAHDFRVNRTTGGAPYGPVLAGRNGRFVAVWKDAGLDSHQIRARFLAGN